MPKEISLSDKFKSIGNGVPYLAAKGLANSISEFLNQNPVFKINTANGKINCQQLSSIHKSA